LFVQITLMVYKGLILRSLRSCWRLFITFKFAFSYK